MGNTWSVISAIKYLGFNCELSNNIENISNAEYIILPGVGSFKKGIQNLKDLGLFTLLKNKKFLKNKKILGICLGFQLLGISSTEEGHENGLNLIPLKVDKFKFNKTHLKVPHIGFNSVIFDCQDKLFQGLKNEADFYFVHSYRFRSDSLDGYISYCDYGEKFLAAYHKDNIYGTQFHPEKSQTNGLILLKNFFEF